MYFRALGPFFVAKKARSKYLCFPRDDLAQTGRSNTIGVNNQKSNLYQPMKWFYVENGQQSGPVEESQLAELIQSGKLRGDTLVWREGMAAWQPFSAVCPPQFAAAIGATSIGSVATTGETTDAVCAECGNLFRKEDMIPHGSIYICANCKPVFMQKMAEGAKIPTGTLDYASVGTRFAAMIIDGLLLGVVNFAMGLGVGAVLFGMSRNNPGAAFGLQAVLWVIQIGISMTYEGLMVGKYGATLGKMACKIKVVTPDGGKISYGRAFGRYFGKMLSSFTCLIGYIMAIFDKEEHRALHDRICNTRVVMK